MLRANTVYEYSCCVLVEPTLVAIEYIHVLVLQFCSTRTSLSSVALHPRRHPCPCLPPLPTCSCRLHAGPYLMALILHTTTRAYSYSHHLACLFCLCSASALPALPAFSPRPPLPRSCRSWKWGQVHLDAAAAASISLSVSMYTHRSLPGSSAGTPSTPAVAFLEKGPFFPLSQWFPYPNSFYLYPRPSLARPPDGIPRFYPLNNPGPPVPIHCSTGLQAPLSLVLTLPPHSNPPPTSETTTHLSHDCFRLNVRPFFFFFSLSLFPFPLSLYIISSVFECFWGLGSLVLSLFDFA